MRTTAKQILHKLGGELIKPGLMMGASASGPRAAIIVQSRDVAEGPFGDIG
jgi:hypothetical protein